MVIVHNMINVQFELFSFSDRRMLLNKFYKQFLLVYHHRIIRHILVNGATSTNHTIVTDCYPFQDNHIAAYPAMLAYHYRSGSISLVFYWNVCVFVTMVMVIYLHVFSKDTSVSDGYSCTGGKRTIVIKETMLTYFYPPTSSITM